MKTNSFISLFIVLIISSCLLIFNACKKEQSNEDINEDLSFEEKVEIEISVNDKYQGLLVMNTPDEARQLLVEYLKENNNLKNVKLIEKSKSIWWEYSNSAHIFRTDTSDMLNNNKSESTAIANKVLNTGNNFNSVSPHNNKVLILSPYQYDFNLFGDDHLITEYLSEKLPEYGYEVTYKVNNNKNEQDISLEDFKSFSSYGMIIILSHGDVYFSNDNEFSKNYLGTGVFVSKELDKKYEIERNNFGLITSSTVGRKKSTYFLSKEWFDDIENKDNTLVYFAVCYGGINVKYNVANSIITDNNSVYVSWNNAARPFFTSEYDRFYFDKLLQGNTHSKAYIALQNEMGCFDLPLIEESCQTDLGISEPSFKIVENGGGSAPVANFTANTTTIVEGESISFTDLSTNNPTSWLWDFGDSNTSISQNPYHIYSSSGDYTVSLEVTNPNGFDTETKNNFITVIPPTTIYEIVYQRLDEIDWDVYKMKSDGTGITSLANTSSEWEYLPTWSPDGNKIIFVKTVPFTNDNFDIYSINSDGSNLTNITYSSMDELYPIYSPNGDKIAFLGTWYIYGSIYIANSDGSNPEKITDDLEIVGIISWSSENKLAFTAKINDMMEIFIINSDGSDLTQLTNNSSNSNYSPSWSPDGSKIAFTSNKNGNSEIYTINKYGSDIKQLTFTSDDEDAPKWSQDGSKLIYIREINSINQIFIMNNDGSDQTQVSNSTNHLGIPMFRPN